VIYGAGPIGVLVAAAAKAAGATKIVVVDLSAVRFEKALQMGATDVINAGIHITSSIAYSRETFQQTVDLVASGQLDVEPVITKEIALDDIVTDGFEALSSDKSQAKILVDLAE